MATDIELVNQALTEIGQDKIVSLDNTVSSKVIQTAIFQLPRIKQAVLRTHDWNCARRRAPLNLLSEDVSLGEWVFNYRLPAGCLAARRFVGITDDEKYQKFSVEQDQDGKHVLLTNLENARLVYTHNLLDVNRWDALLFDACGTRLAIQFAISFARDLKFLTSLWEVYKSKIEEAAGVDEAEGGIESAYNFDMVTVRSF
jgi:hypothetical protein